MELKLLKGRKIQLKYVLSEKREGGNDMEESRVCGFSGLLISQFFILKIYYNNIFYFLITSYFSYINGVLFIFYTLP